MAEEQLRLKGLLIQAGDIKYRIYHVERGTCYLCKAEGEKLDITVYDEFLLRDQIYRNIITVVEEDMSVVDIRRLNEKQKATYERNCAIISEVKEAYGPTFEKLSGKDTKKELNSIQEKYGISSRTTMWKLIRRYLQSGCRDVSLVNKSAFGRKQVTEYRQTKKPGRPSMDKIQEGKAIEEYDIEAMQYGVQLYIDDKELTEKKAWKAMRNKYYSTPSLTGEMVLLPPNRYPTFRQFQNFLNKELSKKEKDEIKEGKQEYRNNMRLLTGSSQSFVEYPGQIVEVDATEVDIELISKDLQDDVGRPIAYFMLDVFSRAIIACSVSFENNSKLGFTNLMVNLADDKTGYGARYGVESPFLEQWPSGIIPEQMRVDRGSEYRSLHFEEICKRLKIEANLLPAATGSLKGLVEKSFDTFQQSWKPKLAGKGLITKKHNSRHHQEAVLVLEEVAQLTIAFVIAYNQKHMEGYPLKKELMDAGIEVYSPINIWNYGCRMRGEPRWITEANHDQFLYDLLEESNAGITKAGITIDSLVYATDDPYIKALCVKAGRNTIPFAIRRDPRDVNTIYYTHDNRLCMATLNQKIPGQDAYIGMTLAQYNEQYKAEKKIRRNGVRHNDALDDARDAAYDAITDVKRPEGVDTKSIRESRKDEKNRTNFDNRLETHMNGFDEAPAPLPTPAPKIEAPKEEEKLTSFEGMSHEEITAYIAKRNKKFLHDEFFADEDEEEDEA